MLTVTSLVESLSTNEDTALTITKASLLSNDSDINGDSLTVASFTQPTNGTVILDANGDLVFTPNADSNGTDSFTYTISDGTLTDTATISMTVNAVNDAPVATGESLSTNEDTALTITKASLLTNDSDIDGDSLTVASFTQPTNGTVSLDANGDLVFTPNADSNGTDSFTYTVSDGTLTDTATISMTVNAVNDAPVATGESLSTNEDTALTITKASLLSNDSDIDGDSLTVIAEQ